MRSIVRLTVLILALNLPPSRIIHAQPYTFSEIRENLLIHRPQGGDRQVRERCFQSIDEMVLSSITQHQAEVFGFYSFMLHKAMIEINTETVEEGATVWQIYNHGFIVKTATVLLGFDLYDFYGSAGLQHLADSLDVLFISHNHDDHLSPELIQAMKDHGKPVIRNLSLEYGHSSTAINLGDSINELFLHITEHIGLHSIPVHMFEVVTPERIRIFHTGDNQTSETLPDIEDVDILLLNAWVNESGLTSHIVGSRNAIARIKPRVTLPGHILELGHLGGYIVPYSDVLMVDDIDLDSDLYVLAWGERYHYPDASNDSTGPLDISDPAVTVGNDSILVSWDQPQAAEDGERPFFYRVIRNQSSGSFIMDRQYAFTWDTIGSYPLRLYSYDACGNQGTDPRDFIATVPDINYPPRITDHNPLSTDTADMFSGVFRVFDVETTDPNSDALAYAWEFDNNPVRDASSDQFIYMYTRIDTGVHQLSVTVSDQESSRGLSWVIRHHNRMALIDNDDTLMYTEEGTWWDYPVQGAHNGTVRFTYLENIGDRVTYLYYPELPGYYDIQVYIPFIPQGLSSAEYHLLIDHEPVDTVTLNQDKGSGKWNDIGRYVFPEGAVVQLRVVNDGWARTGVSVVADAVRFTLTGDSLPIGTGQEKVYSGFSPLEICPNPFSEYTLIRFGNDGGNAYKLCIFDISGKPVRIRGNITGSEYILVKDGLQRGFYLIELRGPEMYRGKIMVE